MAGLITSEAEQVKIILSLELERWYSRLIWKEHLKRDSLCRGAETIL